MMRHIELKGEEVREAGTDFRRHLMKGNMERVTEHMEQWDKEIQMLEAEKRKEVYKESRGRDAEGGVEKLSDEETRQWVDKLTG